MFVLTYSTSTSFNKILLHEWCRPYPLRQSTIPFLEGDDDGDDDDTTLSGVTRHLKNYLRACSYYFETSPAFASE